MTDRMKDSYLTTSTRPVDSPCSTDMSISVVTIRSKEIGITAAAELVRVIIGDDHLHFKFIKEKETKD